MCVCLCPAVTESKTVSMCVHCPVYTEFNSTSIRLQFQNQHFFKCKVPFYSIITEIYAQIIFIITIIIISLISFCFVLLCKIRGLSFDFICQVYIYGVYFELKNSANCSIFIRLFSLCSSYYLCRLFFFFSVTNLNVYTQWKT